ncbi:cache domain-containing sensor histidine kinase [Paenibacillus eucommiae]|uniref:histidine kinase n=1 Tax=Paenibacillus eucommiae TaxID=1355755 RepID=A0ABS4ILJ8_9BACL|nr:sensor histidine kinase [Paenibacillus eucommiae]MBP1988442.1 two-component system sensor histidine kinase YesM [Paenibacillus eucommiae]
MRKREFTLNLFKFKSIQSSIAAAFSCLIIFSIAITSFISYYLSAEAVERNTADNISELMKQVNGNIQSYVTNMENISMLALTNKDVKYYLSDTSFISEADRRPYEKRISDLFQSILISRKDIASIMVFGYNGRFVSDRRVTSLNTNAKLEEQAWYRNAKDKEGQSVLSSSHVQNIIQNEYRWVVSLSRELKSSDGITGEGIFLVDLNLSVINEISSGINLGKRGYVFIVDNEGNLVYHPQQQLIYSGLKKEAIDEVKNTSGGHFFTKEEGSKKMYTVQDTSFGWKIVGVAYPGELVPDKNKIGMSFVLWGIFGLAIALLISIVVSRRLTKPIIELQKHMKQVEKGNFDVRSEITSVNEIGQLSRTFNLMVGQIHELMHRRMQDQEVKRKSELKVLQSQINPHFLYNTLDSIIWMSERKKHEDVVLMTSALAKLFRASITKDDEMVPIRVEIEHITQYLLIQKMRYRDKLDYIIDVDEDVMACKMPKILLQPIVENAIYHGIKYLPEGGMLTIKGGEVDGQIVLTVADNGVGIDADKLKDILRMDAEKTRAKASGVGIVNVHERIQLYFGKDYGLDFYSELEMGTLVTVTIPKID